MLSELEAGLGYTFRDKSILENALTHSSYANENRERGLRDNERLEFLGDSILGFVVADYLYRSFPDRPEGELTRIRADLVCEKNLARAAGTISLGSFLLLCHIIVYGISVHHHLKASVYGHKTLAAAVHHARFLEHRQQLRRLPQGFLAAFYHYVDKAEHVCALIELALYRSAYHARNGKYGSFFGLHHRLVGGLGTHAQRVGQQLRVHLLTALQRLCKAAEYL